MAGIHAMGPLGKRNSGACIVRMCHRGVLEKILGSYLKLGDGNLPRTGLCSLVFPQTGW